MLLRRHLIHDGRRSEALVRVAASQLAELMAGAQRGFSANYGEAAGLGYDPDGWFATVTEGRQSSWIDRQGKLRHYSACEDLPGAVFLRVLGMPPALDDLREALRWCNRIEAGNRWIPGLNLLRLKKRLPQAWRRYRRGTPWDIGPGDAVQIQGRLAHTFVVLDVRHEHGRPVELDHADYGQFHQPEGARQAGHSCRCYRNAAVALVDGRWTIGGKPIIGRASVWDVVSHVWGYQGEGWPLPAWVPEGFVGGLEVDNPYLPEFADTEPCPPPDSVQ